MSFVQDQADQQDKLAAHRHEKRCKPADLLRGLNQNDEK